MVKPDNSPGQIITALIKIYVLKNDADLGKKMKVAAPVISKIRHGKLGIGPVFILGVHETFGMSVADIRRLTGIART